jgi:hypothetical protein
MKHGERLSMGYLFTARRQEKDTPEEWEFLFTDSEGGSGCRGCGLVA